jgi:hypothetical protein
MNADNFRVMLDSMAAAWTARDYEKVVSFVTDDLFYSDSLTYSFSTREELLVFFRDDGGFAQDCRFHNVIFDQSQQLGAAEYTYQGHFTYYGTVWIALESDLIKSWREYQHTSDKNWSDFWKS